MKNNILSLVAIVATLSFFAACSGGQKDQIVRKWQMSEMKSPSATRAMNELDQKIKAADDSIKSAGTDTTKAAMFKMDKESYVSQKESYEKMMESFNKQTWEFMKDGKCEMAMGEEKESGTWSISEDGKKLALTSSNGKTDTLEISELTKDKMVFSITKDSSSITFVPAEEKK